MFIGINDKETNLLTIYDDQTLFNENKTKIKWKLYSINNKDYLIQNVFTKKFWKTKIFLSLDCSGEIQFNLNLFHG